MHTPASSFISIGCQAGGPDAREPCELKVSLYRALSRHVSSSHCAAIDEYALVLRIDGSLDKFGDEGICRLRFAKAKRYISADIQIPESVWKPLTTPQLMVYLSNQVKAAVSVCVARLRKEKLVVEEQELIAQIDAGIQEFLASDTAANNSFKPKPLRGSA